MLFYLASQSPRRSELLRQIAVLFEVITPQVDEQRLADESPPDYVYRLAALKALRGLELVNDAEAVVLGADTIVVIDGEILGKPRDSEHGMDMLRKLSGRRHQVMSAVSLCSAIEQRTELSVTEVDFRPLSEQLIRHYWQFDEPRDKAGGYGIQGLGAAFVQNITGSYSGVVGLPIEKVVPLLEHFGIDYWQSMLGPSGPI